jgi:CheY-like chemotaxis protein
LALLQVDPNSPLHRHITEIYTTGQRSAELTRKLLGFARKQMIAPQILSLNDTVTGMLRMLQRLIGEEIVLEWQPGADLWPVNMDPSQIDQILVNLCVNARDAIEGAGQIKIQTTNSVLDQAYITAHPLLIAGNYVTLSVTDNGSGMSKEVLAHLFEPFFTTKEVGKGTGLGLATVYGIVQQNHGHILVYSETSIGTTFKIYLPSAARILPSTVMAMAPEIPHGYGENVLLVEDDPAVLEMGADSLRKLGYVVNTAATPKAALRLAKLQAGAIDLLITDVIMPGSNGRTLARDIAALQPGLKSLFISGYPADFIAERGVLDEGVHFLPKPFTLHQLAVAVRVALDVAIPATKVKEDGENPV